jgi:hypothetical protein
MRCRVSRSSPNALKLAASRLDPHTLNKTTDSHINHVMASSHAIRIRKRRRKAGQLQSVQSKSSPSTFSLIHHPTRSITVEYSSFNRFSSQ